jgi:N-methylhydantoinase B
LLPTKPSGVLVRDGETIVVESPGAGGYGPAATRSAEALQADDDSGKFSKGFIDKNSGIASAAE